MRNPVLTRASRFARGVAGVWVLLVATATQAQSVYWTDINDNTIKRIASPGAAPQLVVNHGPVPHGITVDLPGQQLYWADGLGTSAQKIIRSNLDGSNRVAVVSEPVVSGGGTQLVQNLKLDTLNNWIYYTEANTRTIRRVRFDGTGDQSIVQGSLNGPFDLALHIPSNYMYWTQGQSTFSQIFRSRLDGSQTQLLFSDEGFYSGIEIDPENGFIYFSDYYPGREGIRRISLGGGNPVTLIPQPGGWPLGMDIDLASGKLYWARANADVPGIFRANLDGTGVEAMATLSSNLSPWDVVIVPEPASICIASVLIAGTLTNRRRV